MLRNIKLTNFKCFEWLSLDCAPINLLCGLNGMGKSSVIQALLTLRQSFEAGELQEGRLLLAGERADLGTGQDVLFEDAEREILRFTLVSDATEDPFESSFEHSREADILDRFESSSEFMARSWAADFLENHPSIRNVLSEISDDEAEGILDFFRGEAMLGSRNFEAEFMDWKDEPPFGGRLVYVNAERVGPRKFYPLSDMKANQGDFGAGGEYAWNYLNHHQNDVMQEDDIRCLDIGSRRLLDIVDQWLQDVCPGAHLHLEEIRDADAVIAGFSFDRPGDVASRRHRATNVGFGLSYALPVILALLSGPRTLCLIENPEAHLHPQGQTKLAELAVRAAKAGVQVFAETHSDHFMDGVRIAVRDGLIAPEEVAFHYFEREGNKSVVTSPKIDTDGRLSSWPAGFFDQHGQNLARLIAPKD